MKIPSKVQIKGKTWKVRKVKGLRNGHDFVMGLMDPVARQISIDADLKGRTLIHTYLHELNHAILFELYVLMSVQVEEIIVEGMSDVYTDLFFVP